MTADRRQVPVYLRIAGELEARIAAGDLLPGDRLPSIRQIADRWGVAIATATRVTGTLRDQGLVETTVGAGSVVSAGVGQRRPARSPDLPAARQRRATTVARRGLDRSQVVRAAVAVADAEGVGAVSMRRVATELGVGPMSLYRHVVTKSDLLTQMADLVFAEIELPDPGPDGWRAKLELVARQQWSLFCRHLWLPHVVSFTRPTLAPSMMAHTEWTLRALNGLGLPLRTQMHEALTLHALVLSAASSTAAEAEAEAESGLTLARWAYEQRTQSARLFASGRFPLLARVHEETSPDLDELFDYGLARHLDGLAVLISDVSSQRPT